MIDSQILVMAIFAPLYALWAYLLIQLFRRLLKGR